MRNPCVLINDQGDATGLIVDQTDPCAANLDISSTEIQHLELQKEWLMHQTKAPY